MTTFSFLAEIVLADGAALALPVAGWDCCKRWAMASSTVSLRTSPLARAVTRWRRESI